MRAKGGNTIPMVFVTTADGGKGIDAIPYATLKADMRKSVRNLKKLLKEIDVTSGDVPSADSDSSKTETITDSDDAPEFKNWQNSAGKTIKAAAKEVKNGKVLFHLPNGKTVWYDITKLSKASQEALPE